MLPLPLALCWCRLWARWEPHHHGGYLLGLLLFHCANLLSRSPSCPSCTTMGHSKAQWWSDASPSSASSSGDSSSQTLQSIKEVLTDGSVTSVVLSIGREGRAPSSSASIVVDPSAELTRIVLRLKDWARTKDGRPPGTEGWWTVEGQRSRIKAIRCLLCGGQFSWTWRGGASMVSIGITVRWIARLHPSNSTTGTQGHRLFSCSACLSAPWTFMKPSLAQDGLTLH